ncbi:nucleoside hydrolase [Isoptericola sp. b441]|uniref:Nucleoside hydrolase n=1 Tax=Actinotalea lenta TaxID=3064654 RepID=A0ABT9D879_9CELL|nr:nucleoside hydrolase [Isoptericola sp. b441]MDO8106750.1 nucleoside hydrolase [Isoptericola sp. b441]
MTTRLILDCDTGTDDAVAIMLAATHPDLELVGVTTVNGNVQVEYCTENTLRVLDHVGRSDVPVHEGMDRPIVRTDFPVPRDAALNPNSSIHGRELPLPPATTRKQDVGAVEFLVETYRRTTQEITLVPVGPLSNIAAALAVEPGLVDAVPEVVIMGGGNVKGNATPSAEFNIWADPEAAATVLAAGFRRVTLVPLDATHQALVSQAQCDELRALGTTAGEAAATLIERRITGYDSTQPMATTHSAPVHDALCVAYLLDRDVVDLHHRHVDVETAGRLTVGRTVMDLYFRGHQEPNCHVALGADPDRFFAILRDTFARAV